MITHLGFDIDTVAMTISCPKDKIQRLQVKCKDAFLNKHLTVHDLVRWSLSDPIRSLGPTLLVYKVILIP